MSIERKLTITDGWEPSKKNVELDGRNINKAIRSYTIYGDARGAPEVTLEIAATEVAIEAASARIHLTQEARDLLIRFGWTPPEES